MKISAKKTHKYLVFGHKYLLQAQQHVLEKIVKELLDYKTKSEAKINSLEKEVKSLKTTNFNENKTRRSNLPKVESISNEQS